MSKSVGLVKPRPEQQPNKNLKKFKKRKLKKESLMSEKYYLKCHEDLQYSWFG